VLIGIKSTVKRSLLYEIIRPIWQRIELHSWEKKGKPVPLPRLMKQRIIKQYAREFSIDTLIETGTYLGDMVHATKDTFSKIVTIELDKHLFERARKKFARFDHISVIEGSSVEALPRILMDVTRPCLFWLDAHYSGGITAKGALETPVIQELSCIFRHSVAEHVILIDDAREFVGRNDYPTIEELRNLTFERRPDWIFEVKDDIIRIHKKLRHHQIRQDIVKSL
jgi:hypothetical protein